MSRIKSALSSLVLLFSSIVLPSTALATFSTVDRVVVRNGLVQEALYYYENNWKVHREAALEKGFISGFRLLVDARTPGAETLLLITDYATAEQYAQREEHFAQVMPADRRPELLNETPPAEFREVEDLGVFTTQ